MLYEICYIGPHYIGTRAPFQYQITRPILGSREVSKPRYLYLESFDLSEIWQALCLSNIKAIRYLNCQFRGFETSRDLTVRRLIGYWNKAQTVWLLPQHIKHRYWCGFLSCGIVFERVNQHSVNCLHGHKLLNYSDGLTKPPLQSWFRLIIAPHTKQWLWLFIHCPHLIKGSFEVCHNKTLQRLIHPSLWTSHKSSVILFVNSLRPNDAYMRQ